MPVNLEDARIQVEIDIRRATAEVREVESQLEKARERRRVGVRRIDPGRETRAVGRSLAAAGAFGAGRVVGGGLRRAVGLAAKFGLVLSAAEAIRQAPAILPEILPEALLEQRVIPGEVEIGLRILGQGELADVVKELSTVRGLIGGLQRSIAEIEATLVSTMDAVRFGADLAAEGKFVEGAFKLNAELRKALSSFAKGERITTIGIRGGLNLSLPPDVTDTMNAFTSYNRARAIQKQYANRTEKAVLIDNQKEAFRAAGGGANR